MLFQNVKFLSELSYIHNLSRIIAIDAPDGRVAIDAPDGRVRTEIIKTKNQIIKAVEKAYVGFSAAMQEEKLSVYTGNS